MGRVLLGGALAAVACLPVFRVLATDATGPAGAATVAMAEAYLGLAWSGALLLAMPALVAARLLAPERLDAGLERGRSLLLAPPAWLFTAGAALLAGVLATTFSLLALHGGPNLIDGMAQLLHARFLAEGRLAGPVGPLLPAWHLQQALPTGAGWVSQYPPGHPLLLAVGLRLGAPFLVGPLLLAVAVAATAAAATRLLPGRPAMVRAAVLLLALSPFAVAHAGAYMSHTPAMALGALAVWAAARRDRLGGALAAGLAVGAAGAVRPLYAVALAGVLGVWLLTGPGGGAARLRRAAAFAVGGVPGALAVAAYNARFFGAPTRFGYEAALGPASGLGFGLDPWGNSYGPVEALGYLSAELVALAVHLVEAPLPLLLVPALWLLLVPRLAPGERLVVAWALVPVVALVAYWHHGLFMGPRMLNEAAPPWALMTVLAASWLLQRVPRRSARLPAWSPRVFTAVLLGGGVAAGVIWLGPARLASYAEPAAALATLDVAPPAVVFVHGGWGSRVAMRLAAGGMRLDSVETAMRANSTCSAHRLSVGATRAVVLRFEPDAPSVPRTALAPGSVVRRARGETWTPDCARETAADLAAGGGIEVAPYLWRGDAPGLPGRGILLVRDLGPAANARLLAAEPHRTPWVVLRGAPLPVPYAAGMRRIWGEDG